MVLDNIIGFGLICKKKLFVSFKFIDDIKNVLMEDLRSIGLFDKVIKSIKEGILWEFLYIV